MHSELFHGYNVLAFANEIYRFGEDLDNDGRVSQSEQLKYDDEQMDSKVFKAWTPFDHPQLGKVEIGGWKKFGQNNPLPPYLEDEIERNVEFMLIALAFTEDVLDVFSNDYTNNIFFYNSNFLL